VSYSLYRKYRPETFTDVIGQEHIETTLCNAVRTNSVSHAYLFCGPRGTGKTTTARLLAKALLCKQAPTDHPDGTCAACREIADGIHPDVYELDAASRTGVENVREEIIGRVQFAPTRGDYKIYIIDEVHMLSTAAFNALLKTLEEPPSHVLFVLCTTDSHKVPETIQSRCQRFDFHRLSEQQIAARLAYICEQEGYTAQPEALALIAQRSQGGMRDAIGSLEQIAVFGAGDVSFEAAESMLGEVSVEQLFSVAALIAARDVANCFAWVASFTQSGTDIAQFVRDLSVHVRNLYIAAVLGNDPALPEIMEADDELAARYREQATLFGSPDRLANVLVVLGDLSIQLRSAANARLSLEIALTRMARPASDLTLESLAARIAVLEAGGPAEQPRPASYTELPAQPAQPAQFPEPVEPPAPVLASAAAISTPTLALSAASSPAIPAAPVAAPAPAPTSAPAPAIAPSASSAAPATAAPPLASEDVSAAQPAPEPIVSATSVPTAPEPTAPTSLTSDAARRLWLQVEKELVSAKKRSVATFLGGSTAHLDPKTGGLLVELPADASFARQNLERPANKELLADTIKRLHGAPLPFAFMLGTAERQPASAQNAAPAPPPTSIFPSPSDSQPAPSATPQPAPLPTPVPADNAALVPADSAAPAETEKAAPAQPELSLEDLIAASFGAEVAIEELVPGE
jgi:DNA polymerase-3 subunit gamma/tau